MTIASAIVGAVLQAAVVFVPIADGPTSQIDEGRTVVIRTPEAWRALWSEHSPEPPPGPDPDFSRFVVLGVFLGNRPTAGYAVEFTSVTLTGDAVVAEYVERAPDPGDITAQVLTAPFHLIRIPRAERVEFRRAGGAAR
jgi:hypothetical protein